MKRPNCLFQKIQIEIIQTMEVQKIMTDYNFELLKYSQNLEKQGTEQHWKSMLFGIIINFFNKYS
jgi:hypothetical protein